MKARDALSYWRWSGFPLSLPHRILSTENVFLRFDGPELKGHAMDVTLFGPSVAALGELCQEANYALNGEKTKVRVLINADIQGNCVTLSLFVVQTAWQAVKGILKDENAESAKALLEWIGLLSAAPGTSGLLDFLAKKKDKDVTEAKTVSTKNGNVIQITIAGDNNTTIVIPEQVYKLSQNPKVVEALQAVISPVSNATGITEASFYQEKSNQRTIGIEEAEAIRSATTTEQTTEQKFTAHLSVYAPVLDPKVKQWRFMMNGEHPYMDISATTIATDTMKRGGVLTGDSYTAEILKTAKPGKDPTYKILQVLEFRPGKNQTQVDLF